MLDDANGHPQAAVDPSHPLAAAPGEVVVDCYDGYALAFERVQVRRQRRDERLAFAGLHFGDLAGVEHGAADQLNFEMPHVEHAAAGLAHDGESLRLKVVESLAL